MDAKTAHAIARDYQAIQKFKESMNTKIERAVYSGEFSAHEYIPWAVSDEAVKSMAEDYELQGYDVVYDDRSEEKNSYVSCDNYSERSVRVLWADACRKG